MTNLLERIDIALGAMSNTPRNLVAYLKQPGPDIEEATPAVINGMLDLLLSNDPNDLTRLRFSNLLRSWDNTKEATWTAGTARNTAGRRKLIHHLLKSAPLLEQRIDALIPFYPLEEPIIISERHQDWYSPHLGVRDYYWRTYSRYLQEKRGWDDASILTMENTTRAIVECLSNPESKAAYASRGLVMGYVQSGKTANFMGVAARSADAGYRLIIVLAGTWNILRNQTQRRFDKELLGKELLKNDEDYILSPPPDWDEFLEHGTDPLELGHFSWQRLTRPDIDFKRLKSAIDNLEFEKKNKSAPIYDPTNLHVMPVKLLIVKKHSTILANLVKDLKLLRTKLADLPTLIIDDESDQAGLNTFDPKRNSASGNSRPPTNARIVDLLALFPRGQYVGYTATPYANALVDPDDDLDLFPKDFIVSLDRPTGYMGVSDFFDPNTTFDDLDPTDFSQPEIAFIRRVENPLGSDDDDIKAALRSYVLAGAIKLYRHAVGPERYKLNHIRHHTMLVHTSQLKGEHTSLGGRLESLWDQCAFNSPRGMTALEELWNNDHKRVSSAIGNEVMPASFGTLMPYLSESIKRIEKGTRFFLILNSDSSDAPDFGADSIWKVVVGGNKLSRGYTIEGLTVSYYRRVAGTGDTLMQMGRWFGFRPGYGDLVRTYLGVSEGRTGDIELVSLFKEVCRMEESFREDIKRYVRKPGSHRITPKEVPPLIAISGSLPPTARNKMFNAVVTSKNFGGQRSMLTMAAATPTNLEKNIDTATTLLLKSECLGTRTLSGELSTSRSVKCDAIVLETGTDRIVDFLTAYRWLETDYAYPARPADTNLQIEFLEKKEHGITSWMILAPQRRLSFGDPFHVSSIGDLSVKERYRIPNRGFQVFGEPEHRTFAEYFSGIAEEKNELVKVDHVAKSLWKAHCGVMLLYPVREKQSAQISIGYELFFPKNNLPFDVNFSVRRKTEPGKPIITAPS